MSFHEELESRTQSARQYLFSAPVLQDLAAGQFQQANYTRFLTNAYHHVKHTVRLMMACGSELPERLHWLQQPLVRYINEEVGHEQWILDDLAACGENPERISTDLPGAAVEQMVSYVYDTIRRGNPIGFFGMVYVLEGTSTAIATHAADLIQQKLGLPDEAFSYLRSHGDLDQEHVVFFEQLVNRLEHPDDRQAIVHVAQRVYQLYGDVIRDAGSTAVRNAA